MPRLTELRRLAGLTLLEGNATLRLSPGARGGLQLGLRFTLR